MKCGDFMKDRFYTIGMAGHIDHGKTALTKALTNIETDRLKEEKERNISIELGYAPLKLNTEFEVSIIDVPGHERFIRQMIAGVTGIDMVLLIVAADEGIMPQTKEHIEVLSFLGIKRGLIVITKIDRVDEDFVELVKEDIKVHVEGTFLEQAPLAFVDSMSGKGIDELKNIIQIELVDIPGRGSYYQGAFRLPIDQVFTVHGQGTVVRGTAYEGTVREGDILEILPQGEKVRVRQMQVHHQAKKEAHAGQRVALNLGGLSKDMISRGDVLVSPNHFSRTDTIDISLQTVKTLKLSIKQRSLVKVHIGTAQVLGTVVFFDRNQLEEDEEILCQVRLNEPIVTKRGDHFILRRPTPPEIIGGGTVIDSFGKRYRFGEETVRMLVRKKEGTSSDRILDALKEHKLMSIKQLVQETNLIEETVVESIQVLLEQGGVIQFIEGYFMISEIYNEMTNIVQLDLQEYHLKFPMRIGKNKAEIIQSLKAYVPQKTAEIMIDQLIKEKKLERKEQFLTGVGFEPNYPEKWRNRIENLLKKLQGQGLNVDPWEELVSKEGIPKEMHDDLKFFLQSKGITYYLDGKYTIHSKVFEYNLHKLIDKTKGEFTLKEAKDVLTVSRKYVVPFLELLDHLAITERKGANRLWSINKRELKIL
jgi:selenocysteine-specific elongation factor